MTTREKRRRTRQPILLAVPLLSAGDIALPSVPSSACEGCWFAEHWGFIAVVAPDAEDGRR
ncbi:hypothetical protein AB0I84_40595 [Streptomyces spectabilis]|uniref:hypothetical protein n=1 Tax=Streptomyces spectabilis TaxID=68270 RepID=UPI003401F8AC